MIKTLNENAAHIRFVLDSGAFTAWKAGKSIELDDYCRFIESLPFKPWRYFTLDVIGNPEASMKNYEAMLKRGFKPIPIFTRGEDPSVINDYYKTSDVVGIGGLVGTPNNKGFVNGIMKHIKDRKVHWLGFTSMDFIKYYKPYMCDSSSWESGARYGVAKIYMGQGRFATVKRTDFAKKQKQEIIQRIRHLGINPSDLIKNAGWAGGPSASRNLCAASAVNLSSELEIKLGVKMFNALTTVQAAGLLMKHYQARQDR
jgi:hypothetical protein